MQWIERNKKKLLVIEVAGLSAAAGTLLTLRSRSSMEVQPWLLALLSLPWFIAFAAGLPLIYLSWFGRPWSSVVLARALKVFFWLLACCAIIM